MILTILVVAAVGIGQFWLDTILFKAIFSGKTVTGLLTLVGKLAIYAVGFFVLFKLFKEFVTAAAIGFAVGFFPALIIYGILKIKRSA